MKRRRFVTTAIAGLALSAISGCQSKEDQIRGKWQVIRANGEVGESYVEFLGDRTAILSTPKFNVSSVHEYKTIEGDRLSLQSKKTNEVEIFSFRFDQGYLFLKEANGDHETKYKRI